MTRVVLFFCLWCMGSVCLAQEYPYFSNYLTNPYAYNPAAAGNSERRELNLTYRQQWLGIQDAPVTQAFNFQMPVGRRVSVGLNFYSDQTILLNTSAFMAAFAYTVPLGQDHFVKFGLSTGVGINNFDLAEVENPADPAISNALDRSSFLTGQFGAWYYLNDLKIGFSLPQLYRFQAIDTTSFQGTQINRFDNFIASASKRFDVGVSDIHVEPYVVYRNTKMVPSSVEAGALFDYNNTFWLGGGYRQNYGINGFLGIQISKGIRIQYAYEQASGNQSVIGNASHEINLKITFGKGRYNGTNISPTMKVIKFDQDKTVKSKGRGKPDPDKQEKNAEQVKVSEENLAEEVETANDPGNDDTQEFSSEVISTEEINGELPKGYHLIYGAFENRNNAEKFSNLMNARGIKVDFTWISSRKLYYVHGMHDTDLSKVRSHWSKNQTTTSIKDVWIFKVE